MRWIELAIDTPENEIDSRCEELSAMGAEGFVIENEADFQNFLENNHQYWDYVDEQLEKRFQGLSRIKLYLADDEEGQAVLRKIQARFKVETSFVQDSDWENNWREFYKPIPVGNKLMVVPEWEDTDCEGRLPLRLDPGLIFGTGSHATTKMCLAALEEYACPGKKFLDLGCGSGILGIGALVLGADSCIGCDIDPKAPDVAMSNAALNGIGAERFKVYAGDIIGDASLRRFMGSGYDLVLANIVSDVIIPLSAYVHDFLKPGGIFICSGIIDGRQDEVRTAIEQNGFKITAHNQLEEWHCFVCE